MLGKGIFTRQILTDTVFSLQEVCDGLFDVISEMATGAGNSDVENLTRNLSNIFNQSFQNFTKDFNDKLSGNSIADVNKEIPEKHVIVVKDKENVNSKFNNETWANTVKSTISTELKDIPVERSLLSKSGDGCIFFPSKEVQQKYNKNST